MTLAVASAVIAGFGTYGTIGASTARADTVGPIDFEAPTYTVGSINGQNGWTSGAARDQGVVLDAPFAGAPAGFGTQSFRLSDATTSSAFGDQTFSTPTVNAAGEPGADAGGYPTGTLQTNFSASFDFSSATGGGQAGTPTSPMLMSVSPDRGDGARMSYVRMEDDGSQWNLFFDDYHDVAPLGAPGNLNNGCSTGDGFVETPIGSYSLASAHNVRFEMQFVPGGHNDVVTVYVDGVPKITGTSWEDYYRYCAESGGGDGGPLANKTRIVDRLLFRVSGDAHPSDAGNGFLIDNVTTSTTTTTTASVPGAPTIGPVLPGDGAVSVAFAPGAPGSSNTLGYRASCVSPNGATGSNSDTASPIVVPGLTNGATYTCSVIAWNSVGNGAPSDNSGPVTPTSTSTRTDDCTDQTVCQASIPQPPSPVAPGQAASVAGTPSSPTGSVVLTGTLGTLGCKSVNGSKPGPITELSDDGFSANTNLTITMTLKIASSTTPGQICYQSDIPFFSQGSPTVKQAGTGYLLRCSQINNVAPCVISSKQVGANIVVKFIVPGGDPKFCVLLPRGRLTWLGGAAAAKVGAVFNAQLQSTGGRAPVHWKISSGKLPPGIGLNGTTGSITGKPKAKGNQTAVIAGTDSASPPQTAKLSVPITVK